MPVQTEGRFTSGPNKGKRWQVYQDPAQRGGYTRKIWDQYDTSNGGAPTEYFEPFDYGAAEVDAQAEDRATANAQATAARVAAARAQEQAVEAAKQERGAGFWKSVQDANERSYQEGVRQFDKQHRLAETTQRDRLRLGLQELTLREREGQNTDARARERNVMDYVGAISKLRLPYAELRALSQRAVAGVIPGAAPMTGAQAATAQAGALTADQWAALAEGTARDYEYRQIGQKSSALA